MQTGQGKLTDATTRMTFRISGIRNHFGFHGLWISELTLDSGILNGLTFVLAQAFVMRQSTFHVWLLAIRKVGGHKKWHTIAQWHNAFYFAFQQAIGKTILAAVLFTEFVAESASTLFQRILLHGQYCIDGGDVQLEEHLGLWIDE